MLTEFINTYQNNESFNIFKNGIINLIIKLNIHEKPAEYFNKYLSNFTIIP